MTFRKLMIFLFVNFVLTLLIGVGFFYNKKESAPHTPVTVPPVPVVAEVKPPVVQEVPPAGPASTPQPSNKPMGLAVCTVIGPLNIEQKGTMDAILSKSLQASTVKVDKKPVFEIYWNLGKDRDSAQQLFNRQKTNGVMQDPKFVLVQDTNKDWIVPVTQLNSSAELAQNLVNQLAEKAQQVNAGGLWQYRSKADAYFYTFSDYSKLETPISTSINVMITATKQPC